MDLINSLIKLQENYDMIRNCNKVLKDGSHIYLLKKLKLEFESTKKEYVEKSKVIDDFNIEVERISNFINEENCKLQENELQLLDGEDSDYKKIQEIYKSVGQIKEKIKTLENSAIVIMEEIEKSDNELNEIRKDLGLMKNNFYSSKDNGNKEIVEAQELLNVAMKNITAINAELPEDIVKEFESIKYDKDKAIVKLEDGTCSGCRMKVSALTLDNIYKKEKIIYCNNCGRILY